MHRTGKLFVISAPSGAGKTTLVKRLVDLQPDLKFSISYTTRAARDREVSGHDYFFVSPGEFARMREAGEFLEYANVFGNEYGTSREQVRQMLNAGQDVLLEIDWQGAQQVRENLPECRSVFILPPSVPELERRLRGRSTDSEEVIARRLSEALGDISHWDEFDYVIVNDDLNQAVAALQDILAGNGWAWSTAEASVRAQVAAVLTGAASAAPLRRDR
ncbi:MAG: guanylate kinase [Gammaproteobacteria bacterium]|nr:guanylate kinase [Gammaproteobacteria bacterium]